MTSPSGQCPWSVESTDHASQAGEDGVQTSNSFRKEFPPWISGSLVIAGLASLACAVTSDRYMDCLRLLILLLLSILFISGVAFHNRDKNEQRAEDVEVQQQLGRVCHLLGEGHSHGEFGIIGTYEGHQVSAWLKNVIYQPPMLPFTGVSHTYDVYDVRLRCPRRGRKWCLSSNPPSMTGEPLEWEIVARPKSFCDRLAAAGLVQAIPANFETRPGIRPAITYLPTGGWLKYQEPPGRIPDVESLRTHLDILVSIRRLDVFSKT